MEWSDEWGRVWRNDIVCNYSVNTIYESSNIRNERDPAWGNVFLYTLKYLLHYNTAVLSLNTKNAKEVTILSTNRENIEVKLNKAWCKGCNICVAFCPKQVLGLDSNGKIEMLDADNCIKCGQCEQRCPDFAIFLGGKE